jgi:hypothetical protein
MLALEPELEIAPHGPNITHPGLGSTSESPRRSRRYRETIGRSRAPDPGYIGTPDCAATRAATVKLFERIYAPSPLGLLRRSVEMVWLKRNAADLTASINASINASQPIRMRFCPPLASGLAPAGGGIPPAGETLRHLAGK